MVRHLRVASFCLLAALLNYPACSATLYGIGVKAMLEKFETSAQPAGAVEEHVDLTQALEDYDSPKTVEDSVTVLLPDKNIKKGNFPDTDDETESTAEQK